MAERTVSPIIVQNYNYYIDKECDNNNGNH